MNQRELILAVVTALLILGVCAYFAVERLVLSPARDYVSQQQSLFPRVQKERSRYKSQIKARTQIRQVAVMQVAQSEEEVRIQIRERLNAAFKDASMTGDLTLKPITGRKLKGVYVECGWSVQAEAPLQQISDFLYLLETENQLLRIANLSITPQLKEGKVSTSFKYMTLVIDPKLHPKTKTKKRSNAGESAPATQPAPREINDSNHVHFNLIAARDIFRPYLKKLPVPKRPAPKKPVPKKPVKRVVEPPKPKAPAADRFVVVGLPSWGNEREIYLKDPLNGKTRTVKPGDSILGGEITGIDYRSIPHPADPEISSGSRVILRMKHEYFAVELGDALSQRHLMDIEELPKELREYALKLKQEAERPATQPATQPKDIETGSP